MPRTFDAATLRLLHTTKEVGIRTSKHPDRDVVIWIVVADDAVFVRSFRGPKGQWYVAASADKHAMLQIGDRQVSVRVTAVVDPAAIEVVSQAFLTKYATSAYVKEMVRTETLPTTLRLDPIQESTRAQYRPG